MKISKTLSIALAVAMAFVAGKAMGFTPFSGQLILNASGTAKFEESYNEYKGIVKTKSFNEKDLYLVISNAVANASNIEDPNEDYDDDAIDSTNLPKDGYIVFNPDGYDGMVYGTFYVTNSSGFYYPLSGFDNYEDYYSFIELDTIIYYEEEGAFDLGFYSFGEDSDLFFSVANYNINENSGNGSDTSTSKALLYVHDYPFDYGDPNGNDDGNAYYYYEDENYYPFYPFDDENENAFEIGGILTTHLGIKDGDINSGSLSLNGSGNFLLDNYDYSGVVSGHASFNK